MASTRPKIVRSVNRCFTLVLALLLPVAASAEVLKDDSIVTISATADWSGTNVASVDAGTSVSLTSFTVGSGSNEALYIALTSQATTLTSPSCLRNSDGDVGPVNKIPLRNTYTWNSHNDTIYLFYRGHGSGSVPPGTQKITCSWSNSATVVIGAASFKNVDTNAAEFAPSIVTASGTSSSPSITIPSASNALTLAVMMRDTTSSVEFSAEPDGPAKVWAYNNNDAHNSVAGQSVGASSVTQSWSLTASAPWFALGINIPFAQSNFIDVLLLDVPPAGHHLSVDLSSFKVGSGANEAMFVGITSPGQLDGLSVIWDAGGTSPQSMSQVDAYAIPDGLVATCATWTVDGCAEYGTSTTQAHLYWYSLKAPHPGNLRLHVSWTSDLTNSMEPLVDVGAISFSGVNQTRPTTTPSHANGLDSAGTNTDSITIATMLRDETVALWGSISADACNWNQMENWPHSGHGIGSDSSRAVGVSGSNVHSLTHYAVACDSRSGMIPGGYWGMSGFDILKP